MNRLYYGDNLQVLREVGQIRPGEAFQCLQANVTLPQAERVEEEGPVQGRLV